MNKLCSASWCLIIVFIKKYFETKFRYCCNIFLIFWEVENVTRIPTWITPLIIVSLNLLIYLAYIAIALIFIFIFSIWSFVSEYVVVRWQQGENGKEATDFSSLVLRVIFNFGNLQYTAYIQPWRRGGLSCVNR